MNWTMPVSHDGYASGYSTDEESWIEFERERKSEHLRELLGEMMSICAKGTIEQLTNFMHLNRYECSFDMGFPFVDDDMDDDDSRRAYDEAPYTVIIDETVPEVEHFYKHLPLITAAAEGNYAILDFLLREKYYAAILANQYDFARLRDALNSAMVVAAEKYQYRSVAILLNYGAELGACNSFVLRLNGFDPKHGQEWAQNMFIQFLVQNGFMG